MTSRSRNPAATPDDFTPVRAPRGRKTKKTIVEEELPDAPVAEVAEADLPSNLDQVLDELDAPIDRIILYRCPPGGKQAYLRSIDLDEVGDAGVQDYVARYYGGGRYLARLQQRGTFVKGYTFAIDDAVRPAPEKGSAAAGGGGTGVTDALVAKLLERAVTGGGGGGVSDLAPMMQAIATIAAGQASAMMTAMTPLLAKITELASGGGKGGSMADLVAAIQLGSELGGQADDSYLPVIKEVGVPLVRALEQYLATVRRPGAAPSPVRSINPVVAAAAAPGATPLPTPPAAAAAPSGPPWVALLAPYIPKLVDFAVHGGDPNIVAGLVYRSNPPLARFLEDAVEQESFALDVQTHFPALAPHATWLATLLDEFREDDPAPDDATEAGDGE